MWSGKYDSAGRKAEPDRTALPFRTLERASSGAEAAPVGWQNRLIRGDSRWVLPSLLPEFASAVNLIYIDPPFATGSGFSRVTSSAESSHARVSQPAFRDAWGPGLDSYLQWLYHTLILLRELLHDDGSLYLHLDWRAEAYARVVADEVFGQTFRNSVIWAYGGRGAKIAASQFPRNHDQILVYSKGANFTYSPAMREKRTSVAKMIGAGYQMDGAGRPFKTAPRGDYSSKSLERLSAEGRVMRTAGGSDRIKYYLRQDGDEIVEQQVIGDVWMDIPDVMHVRRDERTGYPTQKPERLLERILACSTRPGDLVLDCFCGSGTTAVAAERMVSPYGGPAPRRWIACDGGDLSIQVTTRRLLRLQGARPFVVQDLGVQERLTWADSTVRNGAAAEIDACTTAPSSGRTTACPERRPAGRGHVNPANPPLSSLLLRRWRSAGRRGASSTGCDSRTAVHVAAVNEIIGPAEISGLVESAFGAGDSPEAGAGMDILAWEFGYGACQAAAELSRFYAVPIRMAAIPRSLMDPRSTAKRGGAPRELPTARVKVTQQSREVTVRIEDFTMPGALRTGRVGGDEVSSSVDTADGIEFWAIDWDFDGSVFRHGWMSERIKVTRRWLPIKTAASHLYADAGMRRIAVKIVDAHSTELRLLLPVDVV